MDSLFALVVLVLLFWTIAPIFLWVRQSRLISRLDALERALSEQADRVAAADRPPAPSDDAAARKAAPPVPERRIEPPASQAANETTDQEAAGVTPAPDGIDMPAPERPASSEPDVSGPSRPDHAAQLVEWLRENWVLAAGAVSLAFAGIFLVQYGVEKGLLPPPVRVILAMAFGLLLLAGGEVLRRRFGDEDDNAMRFLPSALSGAGFLTLFAAILAARVLYDLIGQFPAFAGLAVVSGLSVLFGLYYGPLLSAVGVIGAIAAPYLVGGETDSPWVLSYYFAFIAIAALAIDSAKRWAWLSVLALGGVSVSIWLIYLSSGFPQHFLLTLLALAAAATTIPERALRPQLSGPPLSALAMKIHSQGFPTWLAAVTTANAVAATVAVGLSGNPAETYLALAVLALIFLGTIFWLSHAPALVDLAALPAIGLVAIVAFQPELSGELFTAFKAPVPPETAPPATAWHLAGFALAVSVLCFLRLRGTADAPEALFWSLASAVFAPFVVFVLEFRWAPAEQYGDFGWAMTVIAVAAAMTVLSERSIRLRSLDEPRLHASLYAAAATALIGLAMFLLFTKAALTLALAIMVLLVVLIDRRFDLPLLGWLTKLGILVIGYRGVFDPGIFWATRSSVPLGDVMLAYVVTGAILFAALRMVRPDRVTQRVAIEGGLWVLAAALVLILFDRLLPGHGLDTHWGMGMLAAIWALMAAIQLRGTGGAGHFERLVRYGLAGILGLCAGLAMLVLFTFASPLPGLSYYGQAVHGIIFANTLALAYLPLAAVFGLAARWLPDRWRKLRILCVCVSSFMVIWYVALSIRHAWRGPRLDVPGITDPELYSYTIAMLMGAAGLLVFAFSRRNTLLRRIAMVAVGITVPKVFLIDMAGLTGLMRVVSFMGLGLSLLGLTWLNRVMEAQWERASPEDPAD